MATSSIVGPDGRPIVRSDLEREIATVTQSGLRQVRQNVISAGMTPQHLANLLRNANAGYTEDYLTLAEEMEERELHYASVLQTRRLAVSGLPFTVEAASDETKDVELADAVRTHIRQAAGFGPLVDDLLDAVGKGISVVEIGWDTKSTPWAPRRRLIDGRQHQPYVWRDPRNFLWDRDTLEELRLRDQQDPLNGLPLPFWKFVIHRSRLKTGLSARAGLARLVAVTYMLKNFALQDWASFAEIFGRPWVIGRHSNAAKPADIDVLKEALICLGSDARAVLPDSLRLEFQEAVSAGGGDVYQKLLEWLDKQISKAVLGQTTSADETAGRLGGAVEKEEIRQDRILADYRQLVATLNEQLVQPFILLNWGPQVAYPRFTDEVPREEDKSLLITMLEKLVPLGMRVEASVIRDKFGLPDPAPDAEVLGAPAPAIPVQPVGPVALNRAGQPLSADQSDAELDLILLDALGGWERQLEPVVNPALELARQAGSYDEFLGGLSGLLNEMSADELVRSLAQATFQARGLGQQTGAEHA